MATPSMRRPKLSLQINTSPTSPIEPPVPMVKSRPRPTITIPSTAKRTRFSYGSDSEEEDGKFWSGEDISSATSSSDDDEPTRKDGFIIGGNTVVLPSPSVASPFLPPATGMRFPTGQRPGMMKLRLVTALPKLNTMSNPSSPATQHQPRQKLNLTIPQHAPAVPRRLGVLPSPVSAIGPQRAFTFPSTKPRKSVSFSSQPDAIISTDKYTLSNADLLEYLSSAECSEEELSEKWGMTAEEGRMLGMPRSKIDRRERKWIGLTNSFLRGGSKGEEEDDED